MNESLTTTAPTWENRYLPDDDGLRFQDLLYTGNFTDLEPVPDGILGDRLMKARMTTGVIDRVTREDVLKDEFTIAELNDLNNYLAWNTWDVLCMRATEGASGMIPRQEYELLSLMHEFYRYPEFIRVITDKVGANGIIELGASARSEIGTKINSVHGWCLGAAAFGMGRCGLLALEAIQPDDYVEESNMILKFMQRLQWGRRQDGYILNSQDRYRCQVHDQALISQLLAELEQFEEGDERYHAFCGFNATAELLSFFDHYDCRLGLGDTGPYKLEDGRILIIRDLFVNEEIFHWSDVCDGLPHCYTLAIVIDPEKLALQEIRVNDISTTFTNPKNYISAICAGAIFVREKWDTPMGDVYPLAIADTEPHLEKIRKAIFDMYRKTAKMSRHELCLNGIYSYYIAMLLPYLRKTETYDYVNKELDFWEIDQRIMTLYYEISKRNFAQSVVPQKIFSGEGFLPFPETADIRKSKYFWR